MSEEQISERDALLANKQKAAEETNAKREGKGTRLRVGQTRGKNPQVVQWEAFDESKPETLPTTVDEFMKLTNTSDEGVYLSYLIEGFNSAQYTSASDPLAEFVEAHWPEDAQKQFRMAVRQYANAVGASLEDAVALIKPGLDKKFPKA